MGHPVYIFARMCRSFLKRCNTIKIFKWIQFDKKRTHILIFNNVLNWVCIEFCILFYICRESGGTEHESNKCRWEHQLSWTYEFLVVFCCISLKHAFSSIGVEPYIKCPYSNPRSQQRIHISVDAVIMDNIFNTQN